jgi:subtilase family serine protease
MRTMKLAILVLAAALVLGRAGAVSAAPLPGAVPLTLTLKLHHEAQLRQLIAQQANPYSPLYGHFLTVAQFRSYFAPTPAEYAATVARLRTMGFTIQRTWANRTLIDVSAPATLVSRTFRTPLTTYTDRYGVHYAALARPQIPATLANVGAVVGVQKAVFQTAVSQAIRNPQPKVATFIPVGPDGGFAPGALSVGLNLPSQHGVTGLGVKVADIIDAVPVSSDLTTFLNQFQITPSVPGVTVVPVDGGGGFDTIQADVDAEWILAAAPGVTLYDYNIPFLGFGEIIHGYTQIVSDNIVDVVNTSFAACETLAPDFPLAALPILEQGAAQGIAFENVAFGSANCDTIAGIRSPQSPSDSADGVSVGGGNLVEDSSGHLTAITGYHSSGGGVSVMVPVLPEQVGLHGVDQSGRNTPDIVVPAEVNGSGPSLFYSFPAFGIPGAWNGGSPFVNNAPFAGVLASYQQMVGHRLGAFDHTLYTLFRKLGYGTVFRDITVGCNGVWSGGPICARSGYDLTGGIGTANFYRLGKQLH